MIIAELSVKQKEEEGEKVADRLAAKRPSERRGPVRVTLSLVRFAASRLFTAAVVTPELLADVTDDIMSTLVRSEQGRQGHWRAKNLMPPPLENVRTPRTAR